MDMEQPGEYLSKKIEPRINRRERRKTDNAAKQLEILLGSVSWQEAGNGSVEGLGLRLSFGYQKSDLGEDWRKLISLNLETVQQKFKHSSDLLSDIQPSTSVSFKIRNFSEKGIVSTDGQEIRLSENIITPKGLIILLHEAGHNVYEKHKEGADNNQESASSFELLFASKSSNKQKLAEFLRTERSADAYALNKLRPFIGDWGLPKSAVLTFIHNKNLQRYSSYLRGATEGAVKSILNDISYHLQDLLRRHSSPNI